MIAKIIDFGFAVLPERGILSVASFDKIHMYHRSKNDIIFLLHHVYYAIQNKINGHIIEEMINAIEPNKTYIEFYTSHIRDIENKIPSYGKMLKCAAFKLYHQEIPSHAKIIHDYRGGRDLNKNKRK
jgi:hypothetical protein